MRQIDVHTMADRIRTIAICIALFSASSPLPPD